MQNSQDIEHDKSTHTPMMKVPYSYFKVCIPKYASHHADRTGGSYSLAEGGDRFLPYGRGGWGRGGREECRVPRVFLSSRLLSSRLITLQYDHACPLLCSAHTLSAQSRLGLSQSPHAFASWAICAVPSRESTSTGGGAGNICSTIQQSLRAPSC